MSELWQLGAAALASLIESRRVSVREAVVAAHQRLGAVNPRINAVVDRRPEDELARADLLDRRLAQGEAIGALGGVPVTVKTNIDQRGFATSNGVRLQKDLIATRNSPVVDALEAAGAVIVGRTNTPAFSYRWFTENRLHGRTFNPHDRARTPGGSSGGAAAAVAAGIGHVAHGTDIAGSIRYPAYACGVHGLRPSLGRVAALNETTGDRLAGPQLMAVSGPLARSIADLRLALHAMARPDPRDAWWVPAPLVGPSVPRRVALCVAPDAMLVDDAVLAALRDASARLRDAGWDVEEIANTPPLAEAAQLQVKLWMGDGYDAQLALARSEGDPGAIAALQGQAGLAATLDLAALSALLQRRATLVRTWQAFFERYPLVLMPVSGEPAFPDALDLKDDASYARVWRAQMPQVGLPFMGLPGLTVTTGFIDGGTSGARLPIGVQLVAGRYREDLCLAAGEDIAARGAPIVPVEPS
ncbi:MAG: amidase family protein [Lautropia sp.]